MKQRVLEILNILKHKGQEGLTGGIADFRVLSDYAFLLKTDLPGKVLLKFEVGGDAELLRVEVVHGFAFLDLSRADDAVQFLTGMLEENVPSFRGSSHCLGFKR